MIIHPPDGLSRGLEAQTILISAANAVLQPPLSLEREVREIENGLRRSRQRFEIKVVWDTTPDTFRHAVREHRPHYVHFCGHGTGIAGIAFHGQLVDGPALAGLFELFADTIKCVFLNACYSEVQARAISQQIDYVVGMNKAIGDRAAIEFAAAFYDAIGAGEDIETAFLFGQNAIQLAHLPEHLTPALKKRDPNAPRLLRPARDWDNAPAVSQLYGREIDAEKLRSWILKDFCRIVLITGLGGSGKSDLVSCLGRGANRAANTSATLTAGIEGYFQAVMWRTILNAPPPAELFADILGVLGEPSRPLPSTTHERLHEVVNALRQRRCLLMLDNLEAVLRAGDPQMRYLEGFEAYGDFLKIAASTDHHSCILLTSREKPYPITILAGDQKPVRIFELPGLDTKATRRVFARIGTFAGENESWQGIARIYGGNPLAMELVAHHVADVYGGDVDAFLASGHTVVADLPNLLAWHFSRLSRLQMEMIDWLAVERVPVSLSALQDELLSQTSRDSAPSTLQSLQRRMPIERVGAQQFTLQPVLIEHATSEIVDRVSAALRAAIEEALRVLPDGGSSHAMHKAMLMLNQHALVKASSPDHVREMQERMILGRIAEEIAAERQPEELRIAFETMLHVWRGSAGSVRGYAAGNVLNLLASAGVPLAALDVSHLPVWQACLSDVTLQSVKFSSSNFEQTAFRHAYGTVFALSFTPDGAVIAAGDDNGNVQLFSAATGAFQDICVGHADTVAGIAFSDDGNLMATASSDHTIGIWDVVSRTRIDTLMGHEGWVYEVAFSPDGKFLASGSEDGTCRLWNLQTGSWRTLPTAGATFIAAVAFSRDGTRLAAGGGGGLLYLFDLDDLDAPAQFSHHGGRGIRSVTFSRQHDFLVTGAEDGNLALCEADGRLIALLEGHRGAVMSVSFSAAGDLIASASSDRSIRLWSTLRKECAAQLWTGDARVWSLSCSAVGRTVAAASEDGAIRTWDLDTRQRLVSLRGYSNKTWGLAYTPARSRLIAANEDAVVRIWNAREGELVKELRGHATRIWAVACSPDGQWAVSTSDDTTVRLWELQSGTCRRVWRGHNGWIRAAAFDASSRYVASAAEDGYLVIWSVDSDERVIKIDSGILRLFATAFCTASEIVAAAGSDPVIRLFSSVTGERMHDLDGHRAWVNALIADGDVLLSCSDDGTAKLWELPSGQVGQEFSIHRKVPSGGLWPAGDSVVLGLEDGMLVRCNVTNGRREAEVRAHQGTIWALAVDRTAETVATAGDDGVIRLWMLPDLIPATIPNALRSPRPYEAMDISGATGLSAEQKNALVALGAIDMSV